jgi:dipeptidyl aminopeptidase/acylaminoacyl peptidase
MRLSIALLSLLLLAPSMGQAQAPAAAPAPAGDALNLSDFLRDDRFQRVKLSPKGTYVAATVPLTDDNKTVLVILKPGQREPYGHVTLKESGTHVVDFWWVNDERLLFTVGERAGGLAAPVSVGEIWGTNADGSRQGIVAGARANRGSTRSSGKAMSEGVALSMVDTLVDSEDEVLVSVMPFGSGSLPYTSLERMNVLSGNRRPVARAPIRVASFTTDHTGAVRFASGLNDTFKSVLYHRANDNAPWELVNDESVSGRVMSAIDFDEGNVVAYLSAEEKTGPNSIVALNTRSLEKTEVARDDFVDPAALVYAVGKRYPIGVAFMDGKPRYEYFQPTSEEARLHAGMQKSFDGDYAAAVSSTDDGRFVLVQVYSDRNPGQIYLFDSEAKRLTPFIDRASWLDRNRLATVRPVRFKARDGVELEALLTLPAGSDGKNLPMIVNPHGGPFGVQDLWGFNPEPQILAAHGYAVLQVNFRGSGGYGKAFRELGQKQWGFTMQDDLTDATQWAIREGVASANRICIYGASYGGYASLMGVAKEPTLYRCAVGYVGVYDLNMLWTMGDIPGSAYGKDFLSTHLGKDELDAGSPNKQVARIQVPVFLAAGGADERAPIEQSKLMERALVSAGKPVETLYYETEGYGFVKREHQVAFYMQLLNFFQRNIGGRAPVAPPVASK